MKLSDYVYRHNNFICDNLRIGSNLEGFGVIKSCDKNSIVDEVTGKSVKIRDCIFFGKDGTLIGFNGATKRWQKI